MIRALCRSSTAMVESVEPESTATISVASPATDSSVRPMVDSLSLQMMATDRGMGCSKAGFGPDRKARPVSSVCASP